MKIENSGDPQSPIWIIVEEPFSQDADKGEIWSAGYGSIFRKVWKLSNIPVDPYIWVLRPTIGATYDDKTRFGHLLQDLPVACPPIIIPTSPTCFELFCPDLVHKSQRKAILKKYSGNLLTSRFVTWEHFIIPQYPPDFITANWDYHEIQAFIDLGHVREEYEYYAANQSLKPLPKRTLITEPDYDTLMSFMYRCRFEYTQGTLPFISVDIETIRPKKDGYYKKIHHPGYPYTNSIAISPTYGISYSFWDYTSEQLSKIAKEFDWLLRDVPVIGQNFSVFDAHYLEALGYRPNLYKFQDTLIRHHILWIGLPHTLQFQTKQYTREPFYKDEGKQWHPRSKSQLMRYNALDTTVTYEVFLGQEKEFNERPHLR